MKAKKKPRANRVASDDGLERNRYQPSGGMCMACEKRADDCSYLYFEVMPVIGTTAGGNLIVKCTEHVRSNAALSGCPGKNETETKK